MEQKNKSCVCVGGGVCLYSAVSYIMETCQHFVIELDLYNSKSRGSFLIWVVRNLSCFVVLKYLDIHLQIL